MVLLIESLVYAESTAKKRGREFSKREYIKSVQKDYFKSAQAVWPKGRQEEMNLFVGFRTKFERPASGEAELRIAGVSVYRLFLNGEFVGYGPARGPHGYYRVDKWALKGLHGGKNFVAIEAAGYNVNSYSSVDEPAFIQAEIVSDGKVVASTGGEGAKFDVCILTEHLQKTQRYSSQRTFTEYYRLKADHGKWRSYKEESFEKVECEKVGDKNLLPRRIAYPEFFKRQPVTFLCGGTVETGVEIGELRKIKKIKAVGPKRKGYKEEELEVIPSIELQKIRTKERGKVASVYSNGQAESMKEKTFAIWDLGTNLTGFIGARINCSKRTKLYISFDEILTDGDVYFKRLGCVNVVGYELEPGQYSVVSFEPYTMRYLKFIVVEGQCEVSDIYLREYANPDVRQSQFSCSDMRLNKLFEAAKETFRQNALDIFMDCPSRERAGWLCDSFFTARVAFDLCDNTTIEKNFLENYLLPERFEHLPEGMLPMCYPADHYNGRFIPNWAMWFVIELEEYLARSGDRELVDALKPRVMSLLKYFEKFRNEDGLLEKLESWVFVEWSRANKFVQDVSYPSNMLYAAVLESAGRLYEDNELVNDAEKIRDVIRRQSFDGEFFVDNALRKDGKLELTRNRTEVCQYFAFFFDVANPNTHKELWEKLRDEFGPNRGETKVYAEIHPANSFVGNYLRMELLSRDGRCRQLKNELVEYFLYMAEETGTLWEHAKNSSSCNHGFASHVAHCLYRDIAGIYRVDQQRKILELRFGDVDLDWCEGKMPTADGEIYVRWHTEGGKILYRVDVPSGYAVRVKNISGRQAELDW